MFTRRSIQRALTRLADNLDSAQLESLVTRLQGASRREQVAAQWETIILAAFAQCSTLSHERDLGGSSRPDIHAAVVDLSVEMVADICAVSDADIEDDNPIERLRNEIFQVARDLGMDGAGLSLQVGSVPISDTKQRRILALPPRGEIRAFVRDEIRPFLREVASNRAEDHDLRCEVEGVCLSLKYSAIETKFSFGNWQAYTWTRTPKHNSLYRALEKKAKQLRNAGFSGPKGILACDGGCEAFAKHAQEITEAFFSQHKSTVSFVAIVDLPEARGSASVRSFLRHGIRMRIFWNPQHDSAPRESMLTVLDRVAQKVPQAITASKYARHESPDPDLRYQHSFEGGFSVNPMQGGIVIRMSARAALQVLSGDLRTWPGVGDSVPTGVLKAQLAMGRTIRHAHIELCPDDDDDVLVLELSDDPALKQFEAPSIPWSSEPGA